MARRRKKRGRRNPEFVSGAVAEVKKGLSPSGFKDNVVDGLQIAVGYAGVGAFGALESRLGLGGILSRVPGGIARTIAGYLVKGINVGLTGLAARTILGGRHQDLLRNIRGGAKANFGVTVFKDVLGAIPGGGRISAYLSGFGNFLNADGWPAMGDWLNSGMQPSMGPAPDYSMVPTEQIWGTQSDIYGGGTGLN